MYASKITLTLKNKRKSKPLICHKGKHNQYKHLLFKMLLLSFKFHK
jgi:hypothetical protein